MNPEPKILLDKIDKRFAARFDGLERKIDANVDSSSTRLKALETAAQVFHEWRPGIEGVVDDLKIEVGKLTTMKMEVGKISKYWERSMVDAPLATPGVFAPAPASPGDVILDSKAAVVPDLKSKGAVVPELKSANDDFQAAGRASTGATAELPNGHRVDLRTRAGEFGVVTTLIPPPGKGGGDGLNQETLSAI